MTLTLRLTNEIPIFVADPPFLRHKDGNSAILDGNLQSMEVVPGLVELEVAVPRSRPAVW